MADGVQKRTNAAVFSLNGFAILVICCVMTQTLIPLCLALNAKFTSSLVESRMISVLVPSYT